ncbi:luciferase family protein [Iodobacter arcticus]|uniref:Luciferase family protein n=2 Tax=Betaproteobacteria TaxID=28216 RepID=A0ABW2QXZ9_9NEIS
MQYVQFAIALTKSTGFAQMMNQLLAELRKIEGVEDRPSPVAGGCALFYFGKEFAHFHNTNELDLRLTKAIIRKLGMQHPPDSLHHPTRSPNSAWIEVRFSLASDIPKLVELVKLAITKL